MTAAAPDPVRDVTGIPARAILDRCARLRASAAAGGRAGSAAADAPGPSDPARRWTLAELRALAEEDFVTAAHMALLGRPPFDRERRRRLDELRRGRPRLELVARLALSAEGRRAAEHRAGGIALPALRHLGRVADRAAASPRIARPMRSAVSHLRRSRVTRMLGAVAETLLLLARIRQMRRELDEVRSELARLKDGGDAPHDR